MIAGCGEMVGSSENGTTDMADPNDDVTEVGQSDSEHPSESEGEANLEIADVSLEQVLAYNQSQAGSVVIENTGEKADEAT